MEKIHKNSSALRATVLFGFLLMLPLSALAGPVIRSGEEVTVKNDQVVEGDLYAAGGALSLSGEVQGDAYMIGGSVTANAPILADVTVVGGTVQLQGPVSDDVRIVGGEAVISESVAGDVFMFGGVLRILSTATIEGDVIFFGGELVIDGPVKGSLFGSAESVRIDSSVGGNVEFQSKRGLTLGNRAEILGNVVYKGGGDITRAQDAVVVGDVQHEKIEEEKTTYEGYLIPLLAMLFAGLVAFLVARKQLERFVAATEKSYGIQGLIGLAVFFGTPFVALILTLSVLGIFVGLFLFACYVALLIAAWVLSGIVVGKVLAKLLFKQSSLTLFSVIGGVVVFEAIFLVPFIGPLTAFATFLIVLGGLSKMLYKMRL